MALADPTAEAALDHLSDAEAVERLDRALAKLEADHARGPTKAKPRHGREHTPRAKQRMSDAMFQRRRAEALLEGPTKVASLRLARELTQREAADRAVVNLRTWARAEADITAVSKITRQRVARALGVDVSELRD